MVMTVSVVDCFVGLWLVFGLGLSLGMVRFNNKQKKNNDPVWLVTVHCDGRHPYLQDTSHDLITQDVKVKIQAKNWNIAADMGMDLVCRDRTVASWGYHTIKVERV